MCIILYIILYVWIMIILEPFGHKFQFRVIIDNGQNNSMALYVFFFYFFFWASTPPYNIIYYYNK